MENTSALLFDDKDEKYFLAASEKIVGPLTALGVHKRIQAGKASLLDFFWFDELTDWKRVCDHKDFATLISKKPPSSWIQKIKQSSQSSKSNPPQAENKSYYLYYNRTQFGPFSKGEVVHVLESQDLGTQAFVWKPGWGNWKRIQENTEFGGVARHLPPSAPEPKLSKTKGTKNTKTGAKTGSKKMKASLNTISGEDETNRRKSPRRPLIARIFLHNNDQVVIAVCRDISIGGMQVLTDHVPGQVGSIVKLHVSPADSGKVKSFVAEGEIVRVLDDGRGFSFRFRRLTQDTKRAIESYLQE